MQITSHEYQNIMSKFSRINNAVISSLPPGIFLDTMLCGSVAKGTALSGASDIDIFIRFKRDIPVENFPDLIRDLALSLYHKGYGKCEVKHGTYPYIETYFSDGLMVNIVPCYYCHDISQIKSTTDRTPFHVTFVNENLSKKQKQDVCLLKDFLKTYSLYGADNTTRGFSGYVCETLVYNFGSFDDVLLNFAMIDDKIKDDFIDIRDPIDPRRELSKAIAGKNFAKFIALARECLGYIQFTVIGSEIKHEPSSIMLINSIAIVTDSTDPPQILKKLKEVKNRLTDNGFEVLFGFPYENKLIVILKDIQTSKYYLRKNIMSITNPTAIGAMKEINFKHSLKVFFTDDMFVNSIEERKYDTAVELLKTFYNVEYPIQNWEKVYDAFYRYG